MFKLEQQPPQTELQAAGADGGAYFKPGMRPRRCWVARNARKDLFVTILAPRRTGKQAPSASCGRLNTVVKMRESHTHTKAAGVLGVGDSVVDTMLGSNELNDLLYGRNDVKLPPRKLEPALQKALDPRVPFY